MMCTLTVNGTTHEVDVDDDASLLWALRDTLGLTGTKYARGIMACGACTVLPDANWHKVATAHLDSLDPAFAHRQWGVIVTGASRLVANPWNVPAAELRAATGQTIAHYPVRLEEYDFLGA